MLFHPLDFTVSVPIKATLRSAEATAFLANTDAPYRPRRFTFNWASE